VDPAPSEVVEAIRSLEETYLIGVDGVTEVLLVRHADVYDQLKQVSDPALSERGREEARRLADRLRALPLGAVYSSPARRAIETARAITDQFQVDDRVAEARNELRKGRIEILEPPEAVAERMGDAVDDAVKAHPGKRVVIVGHGVAIIYYLTGVMRLTPGELRLFPACTSISVVRAKDGRRMAGPLCDVAHLEALG